MMLIEGFKKDLNNSLKEIQESTSKQGEALNELQKNTTKQMKELNKTIHDLKMEAEIIKKKSQRKTTQDIENLGEKTGVMDASINSNTRDRRENLRCKRYHRKH